MSKGLKKISTLFLAALLLGCATKEEPATFQTLNTVPGYSVEEKAADGGHAVVANARKAIGTPYVLGGTKPGGFDCSGLVMWAYQRVGVQLPRTAREQSTFGTKIQNKNDMRPGDIVAFHHPKRGYHTGIYIGDGKFIHSPRKRSSVKISSLDSDYFKSTLLGARRVKIECDDSVLMAASQLDNFESANGYQEIARSSAKSSSAKLKKTSRTSRKAIRAGKTARKTAVKAVASRKSGKGASKSTLSAKASGKSKTASKNVNTAKAAKKSTKSVAQTNKRKAAQTAQARKKTGPQTVSMLHRKSR